MSKKKGKEEIAWFIERFQIIKDMSASEAMSRNAAAPAIWSTSGISVSFDTSRLCNEYPSSIIKVINI